MADDPTCPLTGTPMRLVFTATVLGRYLVNYFYADASGILQTEKPYWLKEAYASAITACDTGIVQRNLANCARLEPVLDRLLPPDAGILDCGGGYGLLARMLRDIGFNCYWQDPFTKNLFARGFEVKPADELKALLAFEVLEHIENPAQWLGELFRQHHARTLFFTTLTFEHHIPARDWWYYGFNTGQHITFYQPRTLQLLARQAGASYYWLYEDFHLITDAPVDDSFIRWLRLPRVRKLYSQWVRWRRRRLSLTTRDHEQLKRADHG